MMIPNPKHAALTGNEVRAFGTYGLCIVIFVLTGYVVRMAVRRFKAVVGGAK